MMKSTIWVLAFVASILTSCAHQMDLEKPVILVQFPSPPPNAEVSFTTGKDEGVLDYVNECYRLRRVDGTTALIVWHSHFTATTTGDVLGVRDRMTGVTVKVGDRVVVGGGQIDELRPDIQGIAKAKKCGGPYVSVNTIRRID